MLKSKYGYKYDTYLWCSERRSYSAPPCLISSRERTVLKRRPCVCDVWDTCNPTNITLPHLIRYSYILSQQAEEAEPRLWRQVGGTIDRRTPSHELQVYVKLGWRAWLTEHWLNSHTITLYRQLNHWTIDHRNIISWTFPVVGWNIYLLHFTVTSRLESFL